MGYSTNASKLQGDPGFFGDIFKTVKRAAGFIPGPIGTIARAIPGGGGGRQPAGTPPFTMPGGGRGIPFHPQGRGSVPAPGVGGAVERFLPGGKTGFIPGPVGARKKCRRMDPLNVKALRRSTRRLAAFQREAKKVEKELRKLAPPARRRSSTAHHHHPKA